MTKLDPSFLEDRQLRDSARAVLMSDIAHAKGNFSAKGVADRVGGRIGDGAKDVFEIAKAHSADKPGGVIAALIGVVLLWLVREPIFEILGLVEVPDVEADLTEEEHEPEQDAESENPADLTTFGDHDEQ